MKILQKIDKGISEFFIFLIKIYQYILSPDKGIPSLWLKGKICMHEPHCSEYGIKVLRRYGILKGLFLASDRVLHCTGGMNKIYDPEFYKVVFFSSAPIGVPFLEELSKDKRFEIVGVVTQCDKPAGRGMEMCENILKAESRKLFPHPPTPSPSEKERLSLSCCNFEKLVHEAYKKHHIYGDAGGFQTGFARDMRKKQTQAEEIMRDILRNRNFLNQKRRRQFPINKYIADFYCHEYKLIIEIDGGIHNSQEQKQIDNERTKTLENLGYTILRYKNEEVYDELKFVLKDIAKHTGVSSIDIDIDKKTKNSLSEGEGLGGGFISTPNKLNPEKSQEGKEFAQRLKNKEPDFLVVIAYGKIIPQAILDIPKIAPINIHGSLLPKYRGASPIQSIFLNNDIETGITIMRMDASMDTGNMIEKLKFKIPFDCTCKDVIEKMKEVGPKFLNDVLWKYGKGLLGEVIQNNDEATYCGKIEKESGLIDPRKDSLEDIYNKYRGFYLWPKIYFSRRLKAQSGKEIRIIIEELKLDEKTFEENKKNPLIEGKNLNPAVIEIKIKPEGKKVMDWDSFVNGYLMKCETGNLKG